MGQIDESGFFGPFVGPNAVSIFDGAPQVAPAPAPSGGTIIGQQAPAANAPRVQIAGDDGCLEKARASMAELREYMVNNGNASAALVVDSPAVPAGMHWILQKASFTWRQTSGVNITTAASGIFICKPGSPFPSENLNTGIGPNLFNQAARGLRLDDPNSTFETAASNDRFGTLVKAGGNLYIPAGCFIRGMAQVTSANGVPGTGYLRLLIVEEANC